jgi:hypothetical protein
VITECAANCQAAQADNLDARKVSTVIGTKNLTRSQQMLGMLPLAYTFLPITFVEVSIHTEANLKPGLLRKVSIIFQAGTDFTQFLFNVYLAFLS